jgi:hypothetical protein
MDRQIARAGAALALGGHVRAAVHGMDLERWVERQQLERDVMRAGTNVEHLGALRQMALHRLREDAAPARASPERGDRVALVVIGRHVPKDFRDQGPPRLAKHLRTQIFLFQEIF